MKNTVYTGIANDDRRIAAELQAMGAFDQAQADEKSALVKAIEAAGEFVTWMRWKGEVGVYGCRVGAAHARRVEALAA
ncbi:hypothetical protein IOQ59_12395 [Pontibacterium sp. N1Y112]|uniref:Uncharacterized protein n=1 Tax=Pontibacterium sinense TaxID=2781979 RepID=A0A8J7FER0_9GAMM|nr:hypothetical protein [Pontibacterium sinense]MBE9398059.1 hypothetical protein [Pontibacterium sinense]